MMRLLFLVVCLLSWGVVFAADDEQTTQISAKLYQQLTQTEALIANKSYGQALQQLNGLLPTITDNKYEKATVLKSVSSIHALRGHYKMAADYLLQAIQLDALPEEQSKQAVLNLGQLYMATEQYRLAINTLEPWLARHTVSESHINVLVANAYTQLKQYRKARPYIKKAIQGTSKPKESWYQLDLALCYELHDYRAASTILTRLIKKHPEKKAYWNQLASTYSQAKEHKKSASVQHLAYKKGLMTSETEIIDLSNLFIHIGTPYRAGQLLQTAMTQQKIASHSKNWELIAHAWRMAKEFDKAIIALEKASKLNDKGSLYQSLGQIYAEQEAWKKASVALNKALVKGQLRHTGDTYLLLGMTYYEQQQLVPAKKAFLNAAKYARNKKIARQWLNYIKLSD